jgi:hypothetical protein
VVVEVLLFSCLVFVGMADYQFLPDMNDPVAKLRLAMDRMDGATLVVSCSINCH